MFFSDCMDSTNTLSGEFAAKWFEHFCLKQCSIHRKHTYVLQRSGNAFKCSLVFPPITVPRAQYFGRS